MSRAIVAVLVVLVAVWVLPGDAHICLVNPVQRNGFNISGPGMMACFRPEGPCGKIPAGLPRVFLTGGSGFNVLLQQNLNHYNPGHPGFIDVAWARGPNPQSSDFVTLATVPDYWPWLQASQTNFSIPVSVPDVDCPHCVLRVRYHPNKPTEPIFHNCADFAIARRSVTPPASFGTVLALIRYERVPFTPSDTLSLVLEDGRLSPLQATIGVRTVGKTDVNQYYFAQGLMTISKPQQQIHFVGYPDIIAYSNNSVPSVLYTFSRPDQKFLPPVSIQHLEEEYAAQPVSIVNMGDNEKRKILVELAGPNSQGDYRYQFRTISPDSGFVSSLSGAFPFDDTFVNFFWADYDSNSQRLYVLGGDENSLFALRVKLFVADLRSGHLYNVTVDNSRYTLTNVHVNTDGRLLALSPGLFHGDVNHAEWTLVEVNPVSGAVNPIGVAASLGEYQAWYGGGVYGGSISNGVVLHAFKKVIDHSIVIAGVDANTGRIVDSTGLQNGVNSDLTVQGLVHLPL